MSPRARRSRRTHRRRPGCSSSRGNERWPRSRRHGKREEIPETRERLPPIFRLYRYTLTTIGLALSQCNEIEYLGSSDSEPTEERGLGADQAFGIGVHIWRAEPNLLYIHARGLKCSIDFLSLVVLTIGFLAGCIPDGHDLSKQERFRPGWGMNLRK